MILVENNRDPHGLITLFFLFLFLRGHAGRRHLRRRDKHDPSLLRAAILPPRYPLRETIAGICVGGPSIGGGGPGICVGGPGICGGGPGIL